MQAKKISVYSSPSIPDFTHNFKTISKVAVKQDTPIVSQRKITNVPNFKKGFESMYGRKTRTPPKKPVVKVNVRKMF